MTSAAMTPATTGKLIRKGRVAVLIAAVSAVAAITAAGRPAVPRLVWNASMSVPTGLYLVRPRRDLRVGALAVVYPGEPLEGWLDEGRYLPRGVPLIKTVLALEGQTVCRAGALITLDGLDVGTAQETDHAGRALPSWQGCRVIASGEVFLMNPQAPRSLDGRYFGALPLTAVAGLAVPLWTSAQSPLVARRRGGRPRPAATPAARSACTSCTL